VGQQAAADWDAYQQWKASRGMPAAAQAEPAQPESAWNWQAPDFDPAWTNLFDANGNPVPGADPTVVAKVRAYVKWKQQAEADFWRNPRGIIRQAVEDDLKRLDPQSEVFSNVVKEHVDAALRDWQARQEAERTLQENQKRLYQIDAAGRPRVDPRTGQMLLSAQGQVFRQYLSDLVRDGMPQQTAMKHALRLLDADVAAGQFGPPQGNGQEQPPSPPSPSGPPQNPRQKFLDRALAQQHQYPGSLPQVPHDGTVPRSPAEPVAGRPRSAREIARQILIEAGDIKE
jgi:hypothetical protein